MSVVLALGLSPIGQATAYAAPEGGDNAQTEQVLGTQSTAGDSFDFATVRYTVGDNVYSADGTVGPTYKGMAQDITFTVRDSGTNSTKLTNEYDLTLVDPDGEEQTSGYTIEKAGTYTIKLKGKSGGNNGDYSDARAEQKFKVGELDLTGVKFAVDTIGGQAAGTFTGEDQDVTFKLAQTTMADAITQSTATAEGKAILAANYEKVSADPTSTANGRHFFQDTSAAATTYYIQKYALEATTDYEAFGVESVNEAKSYTARLEGAGSCTGESTVTFSVGQAQLLTNAATTAGTIDTHVQVNGKPVYTTATPASTGYQAGYGTVAGGSTAIPVVPVAMNKVSDPIEVKWSNAGNDGNTAFDEDDSPVTLVKNGDYKVTYYKATATPGSFTNSDVIAASKIAEETDYYAVVSVLTTSDNFAYPDSGDAGYTKQEITVLCKVSTSGQIEDFASEAVLANGTYLAGKPVKATTSGATFTGEDGSDVSALVGEYFSVVGDEYKVLSTNTYNTARLSGVTSGIPTGAGQYYATVTGATNLAGTAGYTPGDGITALFTVEPRAAVEGQKAGDLKVTVTNAAYKGGNYVKPGVKVEMYTTDGGGLETIEPEESYVGALNEDVVNYKLSYYKDGVKIDQPSEKGTYQVKIDFYGNLEGAPSITKDFEVETGDIADVATSIKVLDADGLTPVDPAVAYTGASRALDPADIVVYNDDEGAALTEDDLAGTTWTLSYSADTARPDAEGNPVNVGTYVVTATFSGTYTGTLTGTLTVGKLDLTSSANANSEVQYLQTDGSYDTDYSVAANADGSAIVPTIRIAVKDGKEKSSEPTLVDGKVYTPTFSNNTAAGTAQLVLSANAGYASYVKTETAPRDAFSIKAAGKTFESINANLVLSKASADYTGKEISGLTVKLDSKDGALAYSDIADDAVVPYDATVTITDVTLYGATGQAATNGAFYTTAAAAKTADATKKVTAANVTSAGTESDDPVEDGGSVYEYTGATVTYTNVTVYKRAGQWYADAACTTAIDGSFADTTTTTAVVTGDTEVAAAAADAYVKGTATVVLTQPTLYTSDASATANSDWFAASADVGTAAKKLAGTVTMGNAVKTGETSPYSYTGTTMTISLADQVVYQKGSDEYVLSGGSFVQIAKTAGSNTYGGISYAGTATVDFTADSGKGAYTLKVLDKDGKVVEDAAFATAAPYTTVTVYGIKDAGKYTVVAGASATGAYAGRVTAEFEVMGLDISDTSKFAITWLNDDLEIVPFTGDWAVKYSPASAKTVAGITLDGAVTITPAMGTKALDPATDYKVAYENNKAAGTAKVTFTGQGNYSGEISKDFTIEQVDISDLGAGNGKYQIDWDKGIYDTASKSYRMAYTGDELKPAFTVNFYKSTATGYETTASAVFDGTFDTAWFNNVDVYYGRTGVDDWATVQVTGTGNYTGTLEKSFYIDPVTLTADNATYAVADVAYTGNVAQPKATVTWNGKELVQGKDFAVDVAGATEVGSYTATIKQVDGGNFLMPASVARDFKVTGLNLSNAEVKLAKASYTYTGRAIKPAVEGVTVDGNAVNAALYEVVYPTAKNVGTYDVTVKAKGSGVTGSAKASFQITKAANTLKVAKAKRTVKYAKLKKAAQKVTGLKVSAKGQGKVTYKVAKVVKGKKSVAKKNFKLAKATANKLTVKKGLAKGNANYNASSKLKKVVTVVVK